jgi:hypothetical protein
MNIDTDLLGDDLSSAMGTETLLAHDLVPKGLPASSKVPAEQQIPGGRPNRESASGFKDIKDLAIWVGTARSRQLQPR